MNPCVLQRAGVYFFFFDFIREHHHSNMPFCLGTYREVKEAVESKIHADIVKDMVDYVENRDRTMMGDSHVRGFTTAMVILTLYHDIEGIGINKIAEHVKFPFKLSHHSLCDNSKRVRELLYEWALTKISIGNRDAWVAAARHAPFKGDCASLNLFIDSTDFKIEKTSGRGPSSDYWSGKEKWSCLRFMTLVDAHKKILKIWPGYGPKQYDSHFVSGLKDWFQEHLKSGHIAADGHFSAVSKEITDPVFYTPIQQRKRRLAELAAEDHGDINEEDLPIPRLTKKNEKYNRDLHAARARVEHPYADIKKMFTTLNHPWSGNLKQLEYLVFYSTAVHNMLHH